jgi:hypothetical protein
MQVFVVAVFDEIFSQNIKAKALFFLLNSKAE